MGALDVGIMVCSCGKGQGQMLLSEFAINLLGAEYNIRVLSQVLLVSQHRTKYDVNELWPSERASSRHSIPLFSPRKRATLSLVIVSSTTKRTQGCAH